MFARHGKSRIGDYTAPARFAPQWYVGNLAFQGGFEHIRTGSMTGGGQVYGHPYSGYCPPVILTYSTPLTNLVAGGQIVAIPPSLQGLIGGNIGNGS